MATQTPWTSFAPEPNLPAWRAALPTLTAQRVLLRELRESDAPSLAAMFTVAEVSAHLSPVPPTIEDFRRFISWVGHERHEGRYVCFGVVPRGAEQPVGLFQIWPIESGFGTAEWGFAMAKSQWGTGLFVESASLLLDFAVDTLNVRRLEARSALENSRGNSALRKLGAVAEGVLRECFECGGEYRDHVMWSILARDWKKRRETTPVSHPQPTGVETRANRNRPVLLHSRPIAETAPD